MARRLCRDRPVDPEDLVQETFERALRTFDTLPEAGAPLRGWLCTVLYHRFLDLLRERRSALRVMEKLMGLELQPAYHTEEQDPLARDQAWAALRHLSARQREVYLMRASGLRYREIAERLAVPVGSVGSWLVEVRSAFKRLEHE